MSFRNEVAQVRIEAVEVIQVLTVESGFGEDGIWTDSVRVVLNDITDWFSFILHFGPSFHFWASRRFGLRILDCTFTLNSVEQFGSRFVGCVLFGELSFEGVLQDALPKSFRSGEVFLDQFESVFDVRQFFVK